jgi:RNA polymerase sigma factor (sigma-70 family)
MEDREMVAAIAAGDPDGLAEAYGKYAESLYGYCRWMLSEPGEAAEAVRDTFALAAGQLGKIRDPGKVRSWLFTTARIECLRRPRAAQTAQTEIDEEADAPAPEVRPDTEVRPDIEVRRDAERAELRSLIRATLAKLSPDEREAVELSLWHDLDDTDLAAVLGVSRPRAYALASNGRRRLEEALGALRIARTGREACPELGTLLADWDGRATIPTLNLVSQHIEQCEACAKRRRGTLRPEALARLLPRPALPPGLREQVLGFCTPAEVIADRRPLTQGAPSPLVAKSARAAEWASQARRIKAAGWARVRRSPKVAAAVAVVLVAAAVSGPLMAVGDAHAARNLGAQSGGGTAGDALPAGTAGGGTPASPGTGSSPSPRHGGQASLTPVNYLEPSPGSTKTVTPSKSPSPKPSGSPQASGSASSSSSATASPSPSHPRSSAPASPTPTSTPAPTPSPSPTSDPTSSPSPTADPTST